MSEIKTNKISPRKGTTQTIGDSGDTVTISSGATLSNAGTISGIQNIDWDTTKKTTAFTAVNQIGYFVDTTSGAITVTFPASPSAGNVIGIKDYALTADTNNITINPNGNNINGSSSNYIINTEGSAAHFIYVDATRGWVLIDASKASDIAEQQLFVTATGGTETTCGDYKIHTFTGPGTFCVSCAGNGAGSNTVDYLVIAGGAAGGGGPPGAGGAGAGHGGGGAGGFRTSATTYCGPSLSNCVSALPVSVSAYPITVGAGGAGSSSYSPGANGSNSVFSTITSAGGGGGATEANPGSSGGSGGGSAYNGPQPSQQRGLGNTPPVSPPQGNNGAIKSFPSPPSFVGGGGGGANAAGSETNGGAGEANAITGSSVTRAGGGGGGGRPPGTAGSGGSGGGGPGGIAPTPGTSGTTNTGSGGGGGSQNPSGPGGAGGSGGSGIVIIRYKYQ